VAVTAAADAVVLEDDRPLARLLICSDRDVVVLEEESPLLDGDEMVGAPNSSREEDEDVRFAARAASCSANEDIGGFFLAVIIFFKLIEEVAARDAPYNTALPIFQHFISSC
jgi:hypothetical protein